MKRLLLIALLSAMATPALNNLAASYGKGEGVPRNGLEAFKWYSMAAKQGDLLAQRNLASYGN